MKKLVATAAIAVMGLTAGAAYAAPDVQVGLLTCDVEPGIGYLIGSSKAVTCDFTRKGYKTETYEGSIDKLGLDIGVTAGAKIAWLVFAASDTKYSRHALAGTYVGASAESTFGVGLGANWLVGGFQDSYALQPWSIQGQIGLNASLTWSRLTLD